MDYIDDLKKGNALISHAVESGRSDKALYSPAVHVFSVHAAAKFIER
jgi:hypothetical protein